MRTVLHGLWIISALGVAASAGVGCQASCSDSDSCGPYLPPSAGSGNHSGEGDAGASGEAGGANGGNAGAGTTGGSGGRGGSGGNAGSGAGAAGDSGAGGGGACDLSQDPSSESCLVDEDHAVFVAPNGKDSAAGTKRAPLLTLSKAIELAAGSKLVLVCDGTFDEHVTIATGARIYGGFKCADWSPEDGAPLFKPSSPGPALKVDAVTEPLLFTRLNFEVGDATSVGETALTALVNASPSVTFDSVTLKAGKGKAGAAGTLTPFTFPDASSLNGNPETTAGVGGASKTCGCQASLSTTGGLGGAPVAGGQNGSKGFPDLGGGLGGDPLAGDCSAGSGGKKGANAPATASGNGATNPGSASTSGWSPASGADGASGSPGQGGGGGASLNASGHGGGGGCGGCGGNGATAGKGGGASIALLLLNSSVLLQASTLTTSDAGDGGRGVAGQPGQQAQ